MSYGDEYSAGLYDNVPGTSTDDLGPVQGARPRLAAGKVMAEGAETFTVRNKEYGENFRQVGPVMAVLFPQGISAEMLHSDRWHIFELIIVKLSRFAQSQLAHIDSIHDTMVYAAMIEAMLKEKTK